ncbi:MAG: sulfite exporter TauE/SafE family protein [Burkholderiaceae bacterium]|nr:MAG: sulfite exporter TauE/SafE family protein [Burkholderiaceae bacterium]
MSLISLPLTLTIFYIVLGFGILLFGATIKGAMGVGMPLVAVPLLSLIMPASQAMGCLVAPVLVSNAMQSNEAKSVTQVIRRMSWLLTSQFIAMVFTVKWTTTISVADINKLVGVIVVLAAALLAFKPQGKIPAVYEKPLGILVGAFAGFIGGVSSLTGPVLVTYLLALRLPRDEFVGTISIIYFLTGLPMYIVMLLYGRFSVYEVALSGLALLPMFLGLRLGKQIRNRLNEQTFRRLLLTFLIAVAMLLMFKH